MSRISIRALLLSLLVVLGSSPVPAQSTPDLELTLSVRPSEIRMTGPVVVNVMIKNVRRNGAVALRGAPGFSAAGGLQLLIEDSAGNVRTIAPMAGELTLTQARSGSRRVVLDAGHAMNLQRRELAAVLFNTPGTYRLHVRYASPPPAAGNASVRSDVAEGAEAMSNIVEITVQ